MKLPNNFGSVYKLSGNRRRPYIARVTVGYNNNGLQNFKVIGYYATKEEGLAALSEYNTTPYDLDIKDITFQEIYSRWLKSKRKKIENSSLKLYMSVYKNHCQNLHDKKFISIRKKDIQNLIDECQCGYTIKKYIKGLCNQLFCFADELDVPIVKNYAKFVELGSFSQSSLHINIKEEEIEKLWKNLNIEDVDLALILIYTGLRPNELLNIKKANVFLKENYMIGGSKTQAGKDRIIPIHFKIKVLIENRFCNPTNYLMANSINKKLTYINFKERWDKMMKKVGLNYLPYDCRHTCATRLDNFNANKICTKLILGHKIADVTDGVYTHKNIVQLVETINLLN